MFPKLLDLEAGDLLALVVFYFLGGEVDFEFAAGAGFVGDAFEEGGGGDVDGEHAVFEGVVEEDVGVAGGYDCFDAEV